VRLALGAPIGVDGGGGAFLFLIFLDIFSKFKQKKKKYPVWCTFPLK